ncbi:MAG: hypothetical protein BWK73_38825 [Thiothrix lacustris]|uniref:Uncharacterized protein n=1 Tax=Thiothrix lacustris TaxID=525917 RepID=A0A1Y1QEB0_9GAMM|nr:MAG: hypothetical protein BWK73_38825 [Thiothrix lacustris]
MSKTDVNQLPKLSPAQANSLEAAPNYMGAWFLWMGDDTQVFVTKRTGSNPDHIQCRRYGRLIDEYQISNMQTAVRAIVYSLLDEVEQHRQKSPYYVRQHPEGRVA